MNSRGPAITARCEPLDANRFVSPNEGSSCGLDFWLSSAAMRWLTNFIHATPVMLEVESGSRWANLCCLLRPLRAGWTLASAYPYGSINGDVDLFWDAVPALSQSLKREKVVRLEIPFTGTNLGQLKDHLPKRARILRSLDAVRHVLQLDAENLDTLEERFDPKIRWAIRKAIRSGCVVRNATAADVADLQSLYTRTMRAKRAPVNYGPKRWSGILSELEPYGYGRIYLGEIDGKPCGMAAVVDGKLSRHLVQLAVPPESQPSRLGELLVATAMRDARTLGKRYFDFMASPVGDTGLIAYKAKWGTTCEPIKLVSIAGAPMMEYAVDLGRWINKIGGRFRGA